jgi:hypothetical protein
VVKLHIRALPALRGAPLRQPPVSRFDASLSFAHHQRSGPFRENHGHDVRIKRRDYLPKADRCKQ